MHPETVVGTKAWFASVGPGGHHSRRHLSRHLQPNAHSDSIFESRGGSIVSEARYKDPPVFGWQPPAGKPKLPWIAEAGQRWTPEHTPWRGTLNHPWKPTRGAKHRAFTKSRRAEQLAATQRQPPAPAQDAELVEPGGEAGPGESVASQRMADGSTDETALLSAAVSLPVLGPFPPSAVYLRKMQQQQRREEQRQQQLLLEQEQMLQQQLEERHQQLLQQEEEDYEDDEQEVPEEG